MTYDKTRALEQQVTLLKDQLKKTESERTLAAEIGQKLLLQTQSLQKELVTLNEEYEKLLQEPKKAKDTSLFISDLESKNNDLEKHVESLEKELLEVNETFKTNKLDMDLLTNALEQSRQQAAQFEESNLELLDKVQSLVKEKLDLTKSSKALQWTTDSQKEKIQVLTQELDNYSSASSREKQDHKRSLDQIKQELKESKLHCKELETMLEEYREYREKLEASESIIQEMSMDMEILQNLTESLKSRLAVLEPDSADSADHSKGKTLLGEFVLINS